MSTLEATVALERHGGPGGSSAAPVGLPILKTRNQAVDALRGLVMILMALDHTRDFFHFGAMSFSPEDLTRTTVALFFTRWATHLCAPVFFFTTGIGAFLWLGRGHSESRTAFLVKRGLWLVLLELTALRLAINFSLREGPVFLSILWALGWSMQCARTNAAILVGHRHSKDARLLIGVAEIEGLVGVQGQRLSAGPVAVVHRCRPGVGTQITERTVADEVIRVESTSGGHTLGG
jgi:uncharacterized membrane protein